MSLSLIKDSLKRSLKLNRTRTRSAKRSLNRIPILLLIPGVLLAYSPLTLFGGFLGDFGDPIGQTIPNKFLLIEYIKNGIFPLWNPFIFMGFPFLADIQVGAFYVPDILIFLIFQPITAHTVSVLFHLIFAAFGMYLFLDETTKSRSIAFSLALMSVVSGSFLSRIVFLNFLETISFVPWLLYCIQKKSSPIVLAVLTAFMVFAGHPVALFYSFLIIFTYAVFNHLNQWKSLLFGFFSGLLLAGIQIVPFLALKTQSVRDSLSYEQFVEGSLSQVHLLSFLFPFEKTDFFSFEKSTLPAFDTYLYFGTVALFFFTASLFFAPLFFKNFKNFRISNRFANFFMFRRFLPRSEVFRIPSVFHKFESVFHHSKFFVRHSESPMTKMYLTGLFLILVGILLSLGENVPILAKILYELPIFNIIRAPARYIVLAHFGVVFSLAAFFSFLIRKYKKIAFLGLFAIVLNSILIPGLLLQRHENVQAERQYMPEIQLSLQSIEKSDDLSDTLHFTLRSVPTYFLASSLFLFPNRHMLSLMPSIIGYNPLMLERFHTIFPVAPVGSFENGNYFIDLYEKFESVGLTYYLFPTPDFLVSSGSEDKQFIRNFLLRKGWAKVDIVDNAVEIWKNPSPTPFAYFLKENNSIESIQFEPGKIITNVDVRESDTFIINQTYFPGWRMKSTPLPSPQITDIPFPVSQAAKASMVSSRTTSRRAGASVLENDIENKVIPAREYERLVQSYDVFPGKQTLIIQYKPKEFFYGLFGSAAGFFLLSIFYFFKR